MDTDAFDRRQVARAFGAVLKNARTRKGLSQNALCDAANMDYTYPSLLERGLPLMSSWRYSREGISTRQFEVPKLRLTLMGVKLREIQLANPSGGNREGRNLLQIQH
jgi:transcriptional regulator with XRE-family HTH domain